MDNDAWQLPLYGPAIPVGSQVRVSDGTLATIEAVRYHPGPLGPVYVLVSPTWQPQLPFLTGKRGYYECQLTVVSCDEADTTPEATEETNDAPHSA